MAVTKAETRVSKSDKSKEDPALKKDCRPFENATPDAKSLNTEKFCAVYGLWLASVTVVDVPETRCTKFAELSRDTPRNPVALFTNVAALCLICIYSCPLLFSRPITVDPVLELPAPM